MKTAETADLERFLARLLNWGTWASSGVIALGLGLAVSDDYDATGLRIVTLGIALFILLPAARLVAMALAFARQGDYRFALISLLALTIVGFGILLGLKAPR